MLEVNFEHIPVHDVDSDVRRGKLFVALGRSGREGVLPRNDIVEFVVPAGGGSRGVVEGAIQGDAGVVNAWLPGVSLTVLVHVDVDKTIDASFHGFFEFIDFLDVDMMDVFIAVEFAGKGVSRIDGQVAVAVEEAIIEVAILDEEGGDFPFAGVGLGDVGFGGGIEYARGGQTAVKRQA